MLFFVEDNGFGISVNSSMQTPGGNIAENLKSFRNLRVLAGDGADPAEAALLIEQSVDHVRAGQGPCLLRLTVPRLQGHSFQDTQSYKPETLIADEWSRDPLPRLKSLLVPAVLNEGEWADIASAAGACVEAARAEAEGSADTGFEPLENFVFSGSKPQLMGGLRGSQLLPTATAGVQAGGQRINMVSAIRRTLEHELSVNPKMLVYGQDVGIKGGVHAATLGLQEKFGAERVFDTSLSEEGIIGRGVGMAVAGLLPVPEIQFRKYADSATEQINDCGTLRWRTGNRFAAPMVVRMPIGFFRCGDPWHSQTNEVQFVHSPGWRVAVPSNAEDAVGLLRTALRGDDPTMFLEHRSMLDAAWARRPYPGDDFVLPFGVAKVTISGDDITVVTWGAMVERCEQAAKTSKFSVEVIDLRTLMPWDRETVLESVTRTGRCLIVHEDLKTAGFGSEVAAAVAERAFLSLDAPISRIAMPDVPSPYSPAQLASVVPNAEIIRLKIDELCSF
jgi:2-oxoisovalerate dehydrogenase E1 component